MARTLAAVFLFASGVDAAQLARKAVPAWACPVTRCTQAALEGDAKLLDEDAPKNVLQMVSLRGSTHQQVLCPFGGDGGGKKASKEEVKGFFDDMSAAYDQLHGIESDESEEATTITTAAPAKVELPTPAPGSVVVGVASTHLRTMIDAHQDSVLVTFYAPWCPHCKNFVMADNAPLEKLAKDLAQEPQLKVVKFDTTASAPPAEFQVEFIPAVWLVTKDGAMAQFEGNPDDLAALKTFALAPH
eukprot:TRINITY_DN96517_c0_g1_i1.p1 TRINITY_DN96517_c0_g1~~TRINITY_DN96517_c0_g1_i1.p1  ORF type:complete len:244 (+),score=83.01 TRINITY_DN96517_c0_g1_i1:84-815(+)